MVMEWNRAWWLEGSEVLSRRGVAEGRSEEVILSRDPKATDESTWWGTQGSSVLARGKSRFSYLKMGVGGAENLHPASQTWKGSNDWKLICEIIKFRAGERDCELFSWSLNPSPQITWKVGNIQFFWCSAELVKSPVWTKAFLPAVWDIKTLFYFKMFKNFDIV